jgi:hypothetical protein
VIEGAEKLVEMTNGADTRTALYDLAADPHERHDLIGRHRGEARLTARLRSFAAAARRHAAERTEVTVADEMADRLKALGYVN